MSAIMGRRTEVRCARDRELWGQNRDRLQAIKLERGCMDCGYREHAETLQFDHRPGTVKLFNLGNHRAFGWVKIEAEVAKCDVVCANCHAVRTSSRR